MSVTVRRKKVIKECDGGCTGGVSAPFNTLNNTGGVGNPVPAQMAAMTAAEQSSPASIGSGDNFGNIISTKPAQQAKPPRFKIRKKKK